MILSGREKTTIKVINEQQAMQVLLTHLEPSKVLRFWAACKLGGGDYLKVKEQLFAQETVASLYDKIKQYQDAGNCSHISLALLFLHCYTSLKFRDG